MGTAIGLVHSGAGDALAPPSPLGDKGRPQVDHASLTLYDSSPVDTGRKLDGRIGTIKFQFNPKEVTIAKSAKWEHKPSRSAKRSAPPQFTGADPSKLTLEMFFDATGKHDGSVVAAVEMLLSCCVPTEKTVNTDKPVTPLVVFTWGKITSFPAFITQVSAKYTLFAPDGTPIRATCSVSMEEMPGEPLKQNPTSGSLAVRRMHRMVVGDSLASVAYAEYGDPTLWRHLADFNRIDDPLRIPLGSVVLIPAADELMAAVG